MRYLPARGVGAWQDDFMRGVHQGAAQSDPDLAAVIDLAQESVTTERQPGGALDPRTPSTFKVSDLRSPMRAYLFYRKHPVATYAIPVGMLAVAFLLGRASAR